MQRGGGRKRIVRKRQWEGGTVSKKIGKIVELVS